MDNKPRATSTVANVHYTLAEGMGPGMSSDNPYSTLRHPQ